MSKYIRLLNWLKNLYHRQPEFIVVWPFRNPMPIPKKFEMKGVILETLKEKRRISHSGNCPHINIPLEWEKELKPPLELHLIQTNVRGVLINEVAEVGGEQDEAN